MNKNNKNNDLRKTAGDQEQQLIKCKDPENNLRKKAKDQEQKLIKCKDPQNHLRQTAGNQEQKREKTETLPRSRKSFSPNGRGPRAKGDRGRAPKTHKMQRSRKSSSPKGNGPRAKTNKCGVFGALPRTCPWSPFAFAPLPFGQDD